MLLVSIVIPVYKVEDYLSRCLESVIKQSYPFIEIILVDDGSPDKSPIICDKYKAKDNRITVIHKENEGLSSARNAGLNIAKGDYITFIDSDDWISETYIETLINLISKDNADIAIAEHITQENDSIQTESQIKVFSKTYTSKQALNILFKGNHPSFTVSWGKLYKKELLQGFEFPYGKFHEDEFTTYKLFYLSNKISYTNQIAYFYFQRANNITSTPHPLDLLEACKNRYDFFLSRNISEFNAILLQTLCWQYLYALWFIKEHEVVNTNISTKEIQSYTKRIFKERIPLIHKIPLLIFTTWPSLYIFLRSAIPIHIRKV